LIRRTRPTTQQARAEARRQALQGTKPKAAAEPAEDSEAVMSELRAKREAAKEAAAAKLAKKKKNLTPMEEFKGSRS